MDTVKGKTTEAADLRTLIGRLTTWVVDLTPSHSHSRAAPAREPQEAVLDRANVVSSRIKGTNRHMVVLDIDHPTYLVRSSTPGHYHLYIDVPGGIPEGRYLYLLGALAAAGVIEEGYKDGALARGWSAVRLPWIKKTAGQQAAGQQAAAQQAAAQQAKAEAFQRQTAEATERFRQGMGVPKEMLGEWSEHVSRPPVRRGGLRWPDADDKTVFEKAAAALQQNALRSQQAAASRRAATMFTDVDENGEDF